MELPAALNCSFVGVCFTLTGRLATGAELLLLVVVLLLGVVVVGLLTLDVVDVTEGDVDEVCVGLFGSVEFVVVTGFVGVLVVIDVVGDATLRTGDGVGLLALALIAVCLADCWLTTGGSLGCLGEIVGDAAKRL